MADSLICRIQDLEDRSDSDNQNLSVDCDAGELAIDGGDGVPLEDLGMVSVHRWAPGTPGLRALWWLPAAGLHLDPLEWVGTPDPDTGFSWPTTTAPDFDVVNTTAGINDSNSGAGQARYGIVKGWVWLPDTVTHWRDNNTNTGELGMVLAGTCCDGLVEQPGGNHAANTGNPDRTVMDPTPVTGGWHYIFHAQSDLSAFGGIDLEYSEDGGTTWANVAVTQVDKPTPETALVKACEPVPDGWQIEPLTECCQPKYAESGGLGEDDVQALIDAQPHAEPATTIPVPDNEADAAIRTGQIGTSLQYARADHNHPIRKQTNSGDPILTAGGNATIPQIVFLDREGQESEFYYRVRVRVQQPVGTGWGWINIPTKAGYHQPMMLELGAYRFSSTAIQEDNGDDQGASPRGPYMGEMPHHWSSTNRIYMPYFRRDNPWDAYVNLIIRYGRL